MLKRLSNRWASRCAKCQRPIPEGQMVDFDTDTHKIQHVTCASTSSAPAPQEEKLPEVGRVFTLEFRRIFLAKKAEQEVRVHGVRSGRMNPHKASRVVTAGDMDVFTQRTFVEGGKGGVAGSLAIVCTLQDLDFIRGQKNNQTAAWRRSVETVFNAARSVGIPVRIFAGNAYNGDGAPSDRDYQRTYDDLQTFFADRGHNSWMRVKESVQKAEEWHDELKAGGAKITLLLTMFPEARCAAANRDKVLYEAEVRQTGSETTRWTRHSRFYAVGVMLEETSKCTWGQYKEVGVHNHFRNCFPSALRSEINQPDELVGVLRSLVRKVAG